MRGKEKQKVIPSHDETTMITFKREDFVNSEFSSPHDCAMAKAIRRCLKLDEGDIVRVSIYDVIITADCFSAQGNIVGNFTSQQYHQIVKEIEKPIPKWKRILNSIFGDQEPLVKYINFTKVYTY